jgi:methionyl-tRNA formyltransferase
MIKKEHGKIDWQRTAGEIYNQYRAFESWPGIWTTWQGRIFKVLSCSLDITIPDALIIPCGGETKLAVTILQPEGKNAMTARDFLNGNSDFNPADLQ